jgi:hypothetical protein
VDAAIKGDASWCAREHPTNDIAAATLAPSNNRRVVLILSQLTATGERPLKGNQFGVLDDRSWPPAASRPASRKSNGLREDYCEGQNNQYGPTRPLQGDPPTATYKYQYN